MSNDILIFATVLATLTSMALAASMSTLPVPEVIPGPGLPSLVSLNLTSAELFAMGPPAPLAARSANSTVECQTYSTAMVSDVVACFNYLANIGHDACIVNQDYVVFCQAGTAGIGGSAVSGSGSSTEAPCWDVALAVQDIFTNCNDDGWVGGCDAANGNDNLSVSVANLKWFA